MNLADLSHSQYGVLFDVRRSVRYHDRRRAYFERLHQITGGLTVLLAGSVLFDLARPGTTPIWMTALAVAAALLSAWDIVVGYASKANLHRDLRARFVALEMQMLSGGADDATWGCHQQERLRIEQDEPPIYRVLDSLCHNELLAAEGFDREGNGKSHFVTLSRWQKVTRHLFHWGDLAAD